MVATVLLVALGFLRGSLFWQLGELKVLPSSEGLYFHAYGSIVWRGYGLAKPMKLSAASWIRGN